jgi:hypothetical protein
MGAMTKTENDTPRMAPSNGSRDDRVGCLDVAATPAAQEVVARLGWRDAESVVAANGRVLRCTPHRLVLAVALPGEESAAVVLKRRTGPRHVDEVDREWASWQRLGELGIRSPEPVCRAHDTAASALVALPVAGRPMDVLWAVAWGSGDRERALAGIAPIARDVASMHAARFVYRDLYWQHLFVERFGERATFLDSERLTRLVGLGAWFARRARGRDLAGLLSSLPAGVPHRPVLEALTANYALGLPRRAWIERKAARIAARQPRFG